MIRYATGSKKSFIKLASLHYRNLNSNHELDAKVQNIISSCSQSEALFLNYLIQNNSKKLKELIISTPPKLEILIKQVAAQQKKLNLGPLYTIIRGKPKSTPFGLKLLKLFDYSGFRSSENCIWLYNELDIPVCPYCNNTTTSIDTSRKKSKLLLDIDHYFCKVYYPFLALSFFNLIPSCHVCNSSYKGVKQFSIHSHLHPYLDSFHNIFAFSTDRPLLDSNDTSFKIKIKPRNTASNDQIIRGNEYIKDLGLIGVYQNFKSEVIRLNNLRNAYNPSALDAIISLKIVNKRIINSRQEALSYYSNIPLDIDNIRHHTLGKMRMDFAKEFNLNT